MGAVKFVPNPAGFRDVLTSDQVTADLQARGERVLAAAGSSAPVVSGEYADSLDLVVDRHADRTVVHVTATAPHAMLVEANTGNLSRALDAAGG